MPGVPIKGEIRHHPMPCEDKDRDQFEGAEDKEHQRVSVYQQTLGERHRTDPTSQPSSRTKHANKLILDF